MKTANHTLSAPARAIFLLLLAGSASAQTILAQSLKPVTITGQAYPPAADVTGFGDMPLRETPVSASVIDSRMIEQSGARRLADITRFDASISDAYNAPGYWDFLSVRGFTLDNRYNYRREGLPANAETSIPLDNKERIEVLKGTSGIQAGTSAPGGLVNYVVKRPNEDVREVRLEWTQRASLLAAADFGARFGTASAFGLRVNVAQEELRPLIRNMDGRRSLAAIAGDWRLPNDGLLEAEIEWSTKRQGSQNGFSLLGNALPAVPDPRLNLNNQPWLQPTQFDAVTGSVRYSQPLARDWRFSVQAGSQRLRTDDYTAFAYGCSATGMWDRFCPDGTFDYYDYRSVGERRRVDAVSAELKGKLATGGVTHDLAFGMLRSSTRDDLPDQAFNWVGIGDISGTAIVPADPTLAYPGTQRDERSLELSARDAIRWSDRFSTWLGVRHTRLDRSSILNDGTGGTTYSQSITTPWVAASYKLGADTLAYASWGQGVESKVVPNNPAYSNAGAVLPALKSRQWEIGVKGSEGPWSWHVDAFDIRRPLTNIDSCAAPCVVAATSFARHRGVEAALQWGNGAWRAGGTAVLLKARREDTGMRPVNVPSVVARAWSAWKIPGIEGLELQGALSHEGKRAVLADESVMLPAWTRFDAVLRYDRPIGPATATWLLGIDNVADKRHWRESPSQFSHVYLYPGAPRTVRLAFKVTL